MSFLKPNHYRRLELFGLSVMSRAYQQLDDLDRARAISADVVAAAEAIRDDVQVGIALSNLASVATALGQFPQALAHRERAEAIRRRQNDVSALPYDLANRADLLIRLGRLDDASGALDELDAGIKTGIDAYVGRARRAVYLRGLAAVTALRLQDAVRHLRSVQPSERWRRGVHPGSGAARVRAGQARAPQPGPGDPRQPQRARRPIRRPRASGSTGWPPPRSNRARRRQALAEAERGLELLGEMSNDELRWRLAAVGTLALRAAGKADTRARAARPG